LLKKAKNNIVNTFKNELTMQTIFSKTRATIIAITLLVLFISCDSFKKPDTTTDQFDKSGKMYSLVPKTTTVFWIGYKTTAKTPVKGQFTKLEIKESNPAKSAREALNGVEFSIPVSSLFSNEASRDTKLKEMFFGVMDQTEFLSGSLDVLNDSIVNVNLKMNGVSKEFPLSYFIDGQMLSMDGRINVEDWNALAAIESLHTVCEDQHTGNDGISKTWSEVGINVESYLKVE